MIDTMIAKTAEASNNTRGRRPLLSASVDATTHVSPDQTKPNVCMFVCSVCWIVQVLSGFNSLLLARVNDHADVAELKAEANVPVINALSDLHHPLQTLADLMTMQVQLLLWHGRWWYFLQQYNSPTRSVAIPVGVGGRLSWTILAMMQVLL